MNRFLHSGRNGDLIYSLYTIHQLGGGEILFNMTEGSLCSHEDLEFCRPFLESLPFVSSVNDITFSSNFSNKNGEKMFCRQDIKNPDLLILDNAWYWRFRGVDHWANRYAYSFGATIDPSLPLAIMNKRRVKWEDRPIVVNLTNRYRKYPDEYYDKILSRNDVIRIGDQSGETRLNNLLEMADLIANSKMFVGNCSCANAIAQIIQHPRLVEVDSDYGDAYPIGEVGIRCSGCIDTDIDRVLGISSEYWKQYEESNSHC